MSHIISTLDQIGSLPDKAKMTKHMVESALGQDEEERSKKQFLAYDLHRAPPGEANKVSERDAAQLIQTGFASAAN